MIIGESAGDHLRPVPARERDAAWVGIKDRVYSDDRPSFRPSAEVNWYGRILLLRQCA